MAKEHFIPPEERQIAFHEGRCRHSVMSSQLLLLSSLSILRGPILEA